MAFLRKANLQDHVIKVNNDFVARSPSRYVTILSSLVATGTLVVEITVFVSHVTLKVHVMKVLHDFMVWSPQGKLPPRQVWWS